CEGGWHGLCPCASLRIGSGGHSGARDAPERTCDAHEGEQRFAGRGLLSLRTAKSGRVSDYCADETWRGDRDGLIQRERGELSTCLTVGPNVYSSPGRAEESGNGWLSVSPPRARAWACLRAVKRKLTWRNWRSSRRAEPRCACGRMYAIP